MRKILEELLNEPEFARLCNAIESGKSPAVLSGVSAVHRSLTAAALSAVTDRPVIAVCADENEAKRMAEDMAILTDSPSGLLFGREFTFYNAESVSRAGEHSRIRTLNNLRTGRIRTAAAVIDGILCRTMPPEIMEGAAFTLRMGEEYDLSDIARRLVLGGYRRCMQVEGAGQFSLRGGILDFFSPAHSEPIRCEFFGDELDSMGFFDVSTQRRTENVTEAEILPTAETLVSAAPDLAEDLKKLLARVSRRKTANNDLMETLNKDIARVKDGRVFPAADRYIDLIYPFASAADYFPPDALVVLCEPNRLKERAKNYLWQLSEDVAALQEKGILEGSLCRFSAEFEDFLSQTEDFPTVMMDSFTVSAYPLTPKALTSMTAKQLPSYGGNLDAAVSDSDDLVRAGYSVILACSDRRRCDALAELLHDRGADCSIDYELTAVPPRGTRT
ncbi:MAG: transcription-repair coupling factor, partial [Oscillospiraceae bacterium]|nr:transcription-repair coupling factor [Oscillospiraceae bacterium]